MDKTLIINNVSQVTSATIIVVFYIICYFGPRLYIFILNNPDFKSILEGILQSDNTQGGMHKLHALLFLFVILLLLGFIVIIYILLILCALLFTKGTFKEKLSSATSWLAFSVWDNGKKLNIWIAILIAIIMGYVVVILYSVMRPKNSKNEPIFPLITLNSKDEDAEDTGDTGDNEDTKGADDTDVVLDIDELFEMAYRYWWHLVVSIAIFTLALLSLYGKSNVNYICAAMYVLSLAAIWIGLQWPTAIVLVIFLLAVPSFMCET